jgi:radical SAM protein with 4Fe4S-binding SPASM domain
VLENAPNIRTINWGTSENAILDAWFGLVQEVHDIEPTIIQGVTTNGFLGHRCSRERGLYDTFVRCIKDVDVSIDFADPARHNAFRGNAAAFDWARETLELCQAEGTPRSIVAVGCEEVLSEQNLAGLFSLASRYASAVRINILRPVPGCRLPPVSYDSLRKALLFIVERYAVVSVADPLLAALMGLEAADPSGVYSLRILPDGSITPSTYLIDTVWHAANIFSDEIVLEQLRITPPFARLSQNGTPPACQGCELEARCGGGCKDRRILWFNTLDEPDPYCPRRHDGEIAWKHANDIHLVAKMGPAIHDGYLPTLIFAP